MTPTWQELLAHIEAGMPFDARLPNGMQLWQGCFARIADTRTCSQEEHPTAVRVMAQLHGYMHAWGGEAVSPGGVRRAEGLVLCGLAGALRAFAERAVLWEPWETQDEPTRPETPPARTPRASWLLGRSWGTLALLVAFATVLGACDARPALEGPVVYIQLVDESAKGVGLWTANEQAWIERGAMQWRAYGFDVRPLGEAIDPALEVLPESDRTSTPDATTAIVIRLHRDPGLYDRNVWGVSSNTTRDVYLNPWLELPGTDPAGPQFNLMGVATHEIGHQLMNAGHLPEGKVGIMSPSSGYRWSFTADDKDMICQTTERCLDGRTVESTRSAAPVNVNASGLVTVD